MTHRYAFIDVDGMLNSEDWFLRRQADPLWLAKEAQVPMSEERHRYYELLQLDPVACELLQAFCEDTGVTAVLSSTWRILGLEERARPTLRARGFRYPLDHATPILGPKWMVPDYIRSKSHRGLEIEHWLLNNVDLDDLDDTRIVIIDDDSDMDRLLPWHVKTGWKTGLLPEHIFPIREALEQPLGDLLATPNPRWADEAKELLYP